MSILNIMFNSIDLKRKKYLSRNFLKNIINHFLDVYLNSIFYGDVFSFWTIVYSM